MYKFFKRYMIVLGAALFIGYFGYAFIVQDLWIANWPVIQTQEARSKFTEVLAVIAVVSCVFAVLLGLFDD